MIKRGIYDCLKVGKKALSEEECAAMKEWLLTQAMYEYNPYEYCCLLGWWVLDDRSIPLSLKEAGFE